MIVPRRPFGPVVIALASIAVMAGLGPLAPAVADEAFAPGGGTSGNQRVRSCSNNASLSGCSTNVSNSRK